MKSRTKEAIVGFVSALAVTVLIVSIIYGKGLSISTEKKEIIVSFETVNGLEIGSKVFVKGVPCGTVRSVDLSDKAVIVKADIESKINIYTDAIATVANKEIMGGKMLVLHVGSSGILLTNQAIKGKSSKGMNEAISEIAEIMAHAKTLIENTDSLIVKITNAIPEADLDKKIDEIADETITTLKTIKNTMNSVSRKFNLTLNKAETLVDSMQNSLDKGKTEIGNIFPQIDSLIFKTDLLISSLNKKVEELYDSTGTIGRLVNSDEFYIKLDRAVTNIDS
ncbi:MAG: MCE family protein, partial [Candidatus Delongbacteria bacterium]|nr:MCE family protein [Candidatus Delongbacteria bacterium]